MQRTQHVSRKPTFSLLVRPTELHAVCCPSQQCRQHYWLQVTYGRDSVPFDAAQVDGSDILKLISCNSAKPGADLLLLLSSSSLLGTCFAPLQLALALPRYAVAGSSRYAQAGDTALHLCTGLYGGSVGSPDPCRHAADEPC